MQEKKILKASYEDLRYGNLKIGTVIEYEDEYFIVRKGNNGNDMCCRICDLEKNCYGFYNCSYMNRKDKIPIYYQKLELWEVLFEGEQ